MTRTIFIAAVALIGLVVFAGCEQRVVRTQNTWITSPYEHAEKDTLGVYQSEKKGPLESIGDFLFGWMDGDDEGPRVGEVRYIDPNQRMDPPKEGAGGALAR